MLTLGDRPANMATDLPLYVLPLPTPSHPRPSSSKKRKRHPPPFDDSTPDPDQADLLSGTSEYTAIITPEERQQRRLAGQPLTHPPPPHPFPHAPPTHKRQTGQAQNIGTKTPTPSATTSTTRHTLRQQHLATLTALLHHSLTSTPPDYPRAHRALSLLLRTESSGRSIDIRHAGLWGIAAELLLHSSHSDFPPHHPHEHDQFDDVSRAGFENAKLFYEKLAQQYPWHRTWPDAVNAQDFKAAMFGLWVWITVREARSRCSGERDGDQLQPAEAETEADKERALVAKRWELGEAEKIAREMDALMQSVPFVDDAALIRLRANVGLWLADLIEKVDELEDEVGREDAIMHEDLDRAWRGEDVPSPEERVTTEAQKRAATARQLAKTMFDKLRDDNEEDHLARDGHSMDYGLM